MSPLTPSFASEQIDFFDTLSTGHEQTKQGNVTSQGPNQTQAVNQQAGRHQTSPMFKRIAFSSSGDKKDTTIIALQDKVTALQAEVTGLQAIQEKGDFKYKTVMEFSAHQHRVISILSSLFAEQSACHDKKEKRDFGEEINTILENAERLASQGDSCTLTFDSSDLATRVRSELTTAVYWSNQSKSLIKESKDIENILPVDRNLAPSY